MRDRTVFPAQSYQWHFCATCRWRCWSLKRPCWCGALGCGPNSEGAGQFRGGFGAEYDLQIRHPSAVVVMRGKDRHRFCAWGAAGGQAATTSGNCSERTGEPPQDLGKQTVYRPAMNEVIRIWSGGGGGWGDPLERDLEAVVNDVAAGLVTIERARTVYGVIIAQGVVQAMETHACRAELAATRYVLPAFDFGPGRSEWEASTAPPRNASPRGYPRCPRVCAATRKPRCTNATPIRTRPL